MKVLKISFQGTLSLQTKRIKEISVPLHGEIFGCFNRLWLEWVFMNEGLWGLLNFNACCSSLARVCVEMQIDREAAQAPAELQYELMVNRTICCKTPVLHFDVRGFGVTQRVLKQSATRTQTPYLFLAKCLVIARARRVLTVTKANTASTISASFVGQASQVSTVSTTLTTVQVTAVRMVESVWMAWTPTTASARLITQVTICNLSFKGCGDSF